MSTRIWSFLPLDIQHVPPPDKIAKAVQWLRDAMPAYKVAAIDHGKIAFFDCGGDMGDTYCTHCNAIMDAAEWSDWMKANYDEETGFHFTPRKMSCCGQPLTLENVMFENLCMFGRFAIQVTDTMKTYSETEIEVFRKQIEKQLDCDMRFLEAHY